MKPDTIEHHAQAGGPGERIVASAPRIRIATKLVLAAALVAGFPGTAAAQQPEDRATVLLPISNASLESAYTLAMSSCRSSGSIEWRDDDGGIHRDPKCFGVEYLEQERMLVVTATSDVVGQIRTLLAEFDKMPETRAFHIIVLSASRTGSDSAEVPAAAREALEDIREFLPYTGFSVAGSGWLRTSRYGTTTLPGAEEFIVEVEFRPASESGAALLIEEFNLYRNTPMVVEVGGSPTTQMRRRGILQTTFTIDRGETVVVGTSKLNGDDDALIVLLTAVQD